jgi:hypothetical protein
VARVAFRSAAGGGTFVCRVIEEKGIARRAAELRRAWPSTQTERNARHARIAPGIRE